MRLLFNVYSANISKVCTPVEDSDMSLNGETRFSKIIIHEMICHGKFH